MTLKYEVTEDDFWAFQDHFARNSPETKQLYRRIAVGGALLLGALVYLLFYRREPAFAAFMAPVVALLWGGYMWNINKSLASTNRRWMGGYYRKLMQSALGEATLEVTPQGLRSVSRQGEGTVFWDAVGQVATTPTHTFVYIGKMAGFIIPQRRIQSGNYYTFMQELADVYARQRDEALAGITATGASAVPVAAPIVPNATATETQTLGQGRA